MAAVYAVGDIQGCYGCLRRLLRHAGFRVGRDRLWCVGDLVNRGPDSLETLRFLQDLGDRCTVVLGNHDLHLLHAAAGGIAPPPALRSVLDAADAPQLIEWLRRRPLLHRDDDLGWVMIHAALHPRWSVERAERYAGTLERRLRGEEWGRRLIRLLQTPLVQPPEGKRQRRAFRLAVLTRGRFCTREGVFNWRNSSRTRSRYDEAPWFMHRKARWRGKSHGRRYRILFGHWAAMGLVDDQPHVLGLDSGCVWGNRLTLARLDSRRIRLFSVGC
ncbi:MAG: symmetrical bis(5'-nucleosyl)-tetraphosphatase [Zetaproteobacteria bacterium]|nr:MAG: symmetrical bis(5'-nucleosyl)-tetraphosphatase [Zetaproteobacteria bacterium]